MSALDKQEGGSHYKGYAIQPAEFIHANDIGHLEGCVIYRMVRWQMKDGIKDLRKAIHEIELLIELTETAEKRGHMEREAERAVRNYLDTAPKATNAVPLGAREPRPAANSYIPGYCLPEGADLPPPGVLADGTRVLVWRPRKAGSSGAQLYGWVEAGFMWDGRLVPHEAEG